MNIFYKWHTLGDANNFKEIIIQNLNEDYDDNWFKNREDAINWLKRKKEEDDLFGDGSTFTLTEMFFT